MGIESMWRSLYGQSSGPCNFEAFFIPKEGDCPNIGI
jgi:hypothetical protein